MEVEIDGPPCPIKLYIIIMLRIVGDLYKNNATNWLTLKLHSMYYPVLNNVWRWGRGIFYRPIIGTVIWFYFILEK